MGKQAVLMVPLPFLFNFINNVRNVLESFKEKKKLQKTVKSLVNYNGLFVVSNVHHSAGNA